MKEHAHYLSEEEFAEATTVALDNAEQIAMQTSPGYGLVLNGSDICVHTPERFSLLFKFKLESNRFAVTLYELKGQFSVTLDACSSRLILNFERESCAMHNMSFSLRTEVEAGVWHKLGLVFGDDHFALFFNCQLVEWMEWPAISDCSMECSEDVDSVGLLTPNRRSGCSSIGEVIFNSCTTMHTVNPHGNISFMVWPVVS
jgi:hypothetical protein